MKKANQEIAQIVRENFDRWNRALLNKDPHEMATCLYAEENTFLPTLSPDFKKGTEEAKCYFEDFLKKNPNGRIVDDEVHVLGDPYYLHTGLYDFEVKDESGVCSTVEARFTYVWKKEDHEDDWKILHHHSSLRPKAH